MERDRWGRIVETQVKRIPKESEIKWLEFVDNNGAFDTYFKIKGQWYKIKHEQGYITQMSKVSKSNIQSQLRLLSKPHVKIVKNTANEFASPGFSLSASFNKQSFSKTPKMFQIDDKGYSAAEIAILINK